MAHPLIPDLYVVTRAGSLSADELAALDRLVGDYGEAEAVRLLSIPRNTLVRALARLPLREGTCLVIRSRLRCLGSEAQ